VNRDDEEPRSVPDEEIHNTTVRTILGSSRRENRWDLAHELEITTFLGKSFFDLRHARPMGTDDVVIAISCILGSVELLVPIGTRVTLEGSTFLAGASSDVSGDEDGPVEETEGVDLAVNRLPRLDIAATAALGRVRVRTPDRPERVGGAKRSRRREKAATKQSKAQRAASLAQILADDHPPSDEAAPNPALPLDTAPTLAVAAAPLETVRASTAPPATAPIPVSAPVPVQAPAMVAETVAEVIEPAAAPVAEPPAAAIPPPPPPPPPPPTLVDVDIAGAPPVPPPAPVDLSFSPASEPASEPVDIEIGSSALDRFDPADFPDEPDPSSAAA
jgi:hypothetical protein